MQGLKGFAGKIFKAGMFLMLANLAGDALIEHLDVTNPDVKAEIKTILPTAAVLFGLLKVRTALMLMIPALVGMALWSLTDFITGDKVAAEYSGFDWSKVALTGPALMLMAKTFGLLGTSAGGVLTNEGSVLTNQWVTLRSGSEDFGLSGINQELMHNLGILQFTNLKTAGAMAKKFGILNAITGLGTDIGTVGMTGAMTPTPTTPITGTTKPGT